MKVTLPNLAAAARPRQWSKNLVCFAALVFADRLTDPRSVIEAALAFVSFCLASSAIYIYNDILDRDLDRAHPIKRQRPIAAGRIGIPAAAAASLVLTVSALAVSLSSSPRFRWVLALYLILNGLYCHVLKHLAVLDVTTIALGFVLRVQAGIEALAAPQSAWVLLCMFFMALFLGFGKRHGEISGMKSAEGYPQRYVLKAYSIPYLNIMLGVSATTALVCYSLYAVTVQSGETFLLTILPVSFGIARYLLLVVVKTKGEDPDEMLTRDLPLVATVVIWALLCIAILYFDLNLFPHARSGTGAAPQYGAVVECRFGSSR